MILKCIVCGKEMEATKQNKKYCSRTCQNKALSQRRKNNQINQSKICIICRKEFLLKNKSANKRQYCYDCLPEGQVATRTVYIKLIKKQYGGKCQICGYNKCLSALEFHHLNPNEKENIVSNSYGTVKDSIKEAKKCILVCANCHREIHENLIIVPDELWKEVSI